MSWNMPAGGIAFTGAPALEVTAEAGGSIVCMAQKYGAGHEFMAAAVWQVQGRRRAVAVADRAAGGQRCAGAAVTRRWRGSSGRR